MRKTLSILLCALLIIPELSFGFGPQSLRRMVQEAGEFEYTWTARNLGWRPNWRWFRGPGFSWIIDGLYKDARATFSTLFKNTRDVDITYGRRYQPIWRRYRSISGQMQEIKDLFAYRNTQNEIINPAEIELIAQSKLLTYLPADVSARLSATAATEHITLADVISEMANSKAVDGTALAPKSIGQVLSSLNYKAWGDFFKETTTLVNPLTRESPFSKLIEQIRSLQAEPSAQRKAAYDALASLAKLESGFNPHLSALHTKIIHLQNDVDEIERMLANPDLSATRQQELSDQRSGLSSEYMAAQNEFALFLRIRQYEIPFTQQYLIGVTRGTDGFHNARAFSDIAQNVDTSIRSLSDVELSPRNLFVSEQMPSFRFLGWSGLSMRLVQDQIIGRFISPHFATWDFFRRFVGRNSENLFPCIRKGTTLYHCKLATDTNKAADDLLNKFREKLDKLRSTQPDQSVGSLANEIDQLKKTLMAQARADRRLSHPDILQGLHSLINQMDPNSSSGMRYRNMLLPRYEDIRAIATEVQDTQRSIEALELERRTLSNDIDRLARENQTPSPPMAQRLTGIDTELMGLRNDLREWNEIASADVLSKIDDIEKLALDMSVARDLGFTPQGLPIHGLPYTGNKLFSLGTIAFTMIPIMPLTRITRFTGRGIRRLFKGHLANFLSDHQKAFSRRARILKENIPDLSDQTLVLEGLQRAEKRTLTMIKAFSELSLPPRKIEQLVNATTARSPETFLLHTQQFVDDYSRAFARRRHIRELELANATYARRHSELTTELRERIRRPDVAEQDITQSSHALVQDMYRIRKEIETMEQDLGISAREAPARRTDALAAQQLAYETAITDYTRIYHRHQALEAERQTLTHIRERGTLDPHAASRLDRIQRELLGLTHRLEQSQRSIDNALAQLGDFSTRQQRLEVELTHVENAERAYGKLVHERDTLRDNLFELDYLTPRSRAYIDIEASRTTITRRLSELEADGGPIDIARNNMESTRAGFHQKYPEYDLGARLRASTLDRDLPGAGRRYNQLTAELYRRHLEPYALRGGSEAIRTAEQIRRHGIEAQYESMETLIRRCFISTGRGRSALGAGRHVIDAFSGPAVRTRLDQLQNSPLQFAQ